MPLEGRSSGKHLDRHFCLSCSRHSLAGCRHGAPYIVINRGPTDSRRPFVSLLRLDGDLIEIFPQPVEQLYPAPELIIVRAHVRALWFLVSPYAVEFGSA